jgi:aminoglycoside N3'-acetyltransferase
VKEPQEQLELTRSVNQLTSLHYAEYTVTTTKMITINCKKKNAKKENERKWNNIMETTSVEMWQQRPCIFNVSTKEFHDRVKGYSLAKNSRRP